MRGALEQPAIRPDPHTLSPAQAEYRRCTTRRDPQDKNYHSSDDYALQKTSQRPHTNDEACVLVALEHGINGYPNVAHGGFLGFIVDESMGTLLICNKDRNKDEIGNPVDVDTLVTASLKVIYLKAVMTPQIVLITVKIGEINGRKFYLTGSVTDGGGTLLAKAEAVWVGIKYPRTRKL